MKRINRNKAISLICKKQLAALSVEERESYILDWWGIDEDDNEFSQLSTELQNQILENEEPPEDYENCKYDELLLIALTSELKGVTNRFIAESIEKLGLGTYEIYGEVEKLEVCPCCNYRTLEARGEYYICGLCDWEDNGATKDEQYSGPNHMTLGQARKNFLKEKSRLPTRKWAKA